MTRRGLAGRLRRDARGSTIVEFALIMIPVCVLVMGSLELGYRIYAQSIITGSLREASRMASTGSYTGEEIDSYIDQRLHDFRENGSVAIDKRSYSDFTNVGMPEPITSGTYASGVYCYDDVNENGTYDEDQGMAGLGRAEDIIYYEVSLTYPALFPFITNTLGLPDEMKVSANTIVSNEPYAPVEIVVPTNHCVG